MKQLYALNLGKSKIAIYTGKGGFKVNRFDIKTDNSSNKVLLNNYTLENERLKKVYDGEYDVLVKEEISKNTGKTFLAEAYISEDLFYNRKINFNVICSMLSKKILNI